MRIDEERREVRRLLTGESGGAAEEGRGGPESSRERLWRRLELPVPARAPAGFAARAVARAVAERRQAFELPVAPLWARAAATLALVAGIAVGAGLALATGGEPDYGDALAWGDGSLAEELIADVEASLSGAEASVPSASPERTP